ncbi:hypothetical protein EXIGLDRAFT_726725 [Exidia glandulosa HHB12029]|uniref:Uncharacterized protein n=1 Tax=Exidia glandulosa HHB12029 TaxID=1314781 RepID=A0A165DKZ9_EXIGL|nr:hypothetical protein EXIGLDRAFT_726725 [Exidia glandulosa HHB12029]
MLIGNSIGDDGNADAGHKDKVNPMIDKDYAKVVQTADNPKQLNNFRLRDLLETLLRTIANVFAFTKGYDDYAQGVSFPADLQLFWSRLLLDKGAADSNVVPITTEESSPDLPPRRDVGACLFKGSQALLEALRRLFGVAIEGNTGGTSVTKSFSSEGVDALEVNTQCIMQDDTVLDGPYSEIFTRGPENECNNEASAVLAYSVFGLPPPLAPRDLTSAGEDEERVVFLPTDTAFYWNNVSPPVPDPSAYDDE